MFRKRKTMTELVNGQKETLGLAISCWNKMYPLSGSHHEKKHKESFYTKKKKIRTLFPSLSPTYLSIFIILYPTACS